MSLFLFRGDTGKPECSTPPLRFGEGDGPKDSFGGGEEKKPSTNQPIPNSWVFDLY
jgi:hypothetical protein